MANQNANQTQRKAGAKNSSGAAGNNESSNEFLTQNNEMKSYQRFPKWFDKVSCQLTTNKSPTTVVVLLRIPDRTGSATPPSQTSQRPAACSFSKRHNACSENGMQQLS